MQLNIDYCWFEINYHVNMSQLSSYIAIWRAKTHTKMNGKCLGMALGYLKNAYFATFCNFSKLFGPATMVNAFDRQRLFAWIWQERESVVLCYFIYSLFNDSRYLQSSNFPAGQRLPDLFVFSFVRHFVRTINDWQLNEAIKKGKFIFNQMMNWQDTNIYIRIFRFIYSMFVSILHWCIVFFV